MAVKSDVFDIDLTKYGFRDPELYTFKSKKGLSREVVEQISYMKGEPEWMRQRRLRALEIFWQKPMPTWGGDLSALNFDEIYYYVRPDDKKATSWDDVPEYIRNTFDRLGIPEAERKFLAGVGAQYECLSGDARIYTARGLIPIQDVQPGDIVFSFDEETNQLTPSQVKATACKGEREVFEVHVGTRTIKATANHPFLTLDYQHAPGRQRGRYRRTWKYLHELKPGDLVAVTKRLPDVGQPWVLKQPAIKTEVVGRNQTVEYPLDISRRYNSISLPEETSSDLMWWLGLYLGDGFIHYQSGTDKARVEFAIPDSDKPLRAEFASVTERLFGLAPTNGDPQRMTVYSTILARFLEANGFAGDAHTKRIPGWVFTLPQEQILAFLGGYVDADGYVRDGAKNHDVVLTSGNEPLLQGVKALAALCGLPTSAIHRFKSRHPSDENRTIVGYRMQIAGEFERLGCRSPQRTERLGKRQYHHDYSSARGTTFRKHVNDFIGFARIDAITPAGVEPVYDIEVEGPHNFVAEGLIVHNSEVVYHNLQKKWEEMGVIFVDTDTAVQQYPDLVKQYFGTVIPAADNKFAALNTAVWSGGSFIYVPEGVNVEIPLQAYFRINAENMGQFERTLIIVERGARVHYVEGCLPAGEQVATGERWVNIEAIQPGDVVLNALGEETRVQAIMTRPFKGNLVEITPLSPGNAFRLTPEHPVLCVRREDVRVKKKARHGWLPEVNTEKLLAATPRYIEAGQLAEGDFLVFPISQVTRDDEALTTDVMRLLGYYLAEGSAYVHRQLNMPVVAFSLGEDDREVIEEVKELIRRVTGKKAYEVAARGRHAVNITVYSRELMDLCVQECGRGAADKRLSRRVMELPPAKQAHLLETYFKGDGSVYEQGRVMLRASTASRVLAGQLQELLGRQGIYASIMHRAGGEDKIQGRPITRQDQYILYYASDKKHSQVRFAGQYFLVPIKKLRRIPYDGPVFNFEVNSAPNSYLVRGFTVHNCTAPIYSTHSLHSAVVEIIARPGAHVRYTTIQNWAHNIYNLVTKRAVAQEEATVEWVDGNIGSKLTMKYPAVYLMGPGAKGETLSIAFAGRGQHQDAGAKMIHAAPHTTSTITSKSISKDGGRATYRGLAKVVRGAVDSKVSVRCDALILDEYSRSDTIPYIEVDEERVHLAHEATVGKIGEDQLFYLMSRGLTESEAMSMIVMGFMEPFTKELPLEYAVELNRLIQLEMEGSVG